MYEEYFGLKRPPFRITPDTSLFYDGGQRGDILGALVYAVHRGEGIIKVVGEVGSGKTMLCRMLQLELPDDVEIIYIANPSVSAQDILFVIANELDFEVDRDASKHEVMTMLQNYLLKKHEEDKQVVLFVEEAQGMPLETLEEIRLLSNLETDQNKLLQIILFGQPELDENLADQSIRQLRERITHDFQLKPLDAEQIHSYLNYRLREVGYTGPELISKKLAARMAAHSEGLLRRINILADKMLLSAFADGTHTLTTKHLQDAVKDSGFMPIHRRRLPWTWWLVGLFGVLVILALAIAVMTNPYYSQKLSFGGADRPSVQAGPVMRDENKQGEPASNQSLSAETSTGGDQSQLQRPDPTATSDPPRSSGLMSASPVADVSDRSVKSELAQEKNQQSSAIIDKVTSNQIVEDLSSSKQSDDYLEWLDQKLSASKVWLRGADKQGVSIQVMMRSKSAARDLVAYLQTEWPLDLEKTYLYEVDMKDQTIYRVFYNEYPTISLGQMKMKQLPESVRLNSPYLHSIYRMQQALL
jgi:MSHA biogenesis protein MshM